MLEIPWDVIDATTVDELAEPRGKSERSRGYRDWDVPTGEVSDLLIDHLYTAAGAIGHHRYQAAMDEIRDARQGKFRQVKTPWAVSEVLLAYLRVDVIDGWAYSETTFGGLQPVLITDIGSGSGGYKLAYQCTTDRGFAGTVEPVLVLDREFQADFRPGRPETLLRRMGLQKETPALRQAYTAAEQRLTDLIAAGPGVRCTVTGLLRRRTVGENVSSTVTNRPVITDTTGRIDLLAEDDPRKNEQAQVPGDPAIARKPHLLALEVFDTVSHKPYCTHIDHVSVHTYRDDVRDLVVLPATHRRLLDVITFDTSYAGDLLEDRTAGSTILATGQPGCGKTLTAQVYAEALHKPLYSVDAGILLKDGVNGVHEQIATMFERCRRWDAVLLLDEVDVIVGQRDTDIARNTLTAAFLRVMETFDRLTFMTTNRIADVDDAILSRCAARLVYEPPTGDQAKKVWKLLAGIHDVVLSAELLDELVQAYPRIAPRDIRQLLRLAVQMAAHDRVPLSLTVFHEVAQFRGIRPEDTADRSPQHAH